MCHARVRRAIDGCVAPDANRDASRLDGSDVSLGVRVSGDTVLSDAGTWEREKCVGATTIGVEQIEVDQRVEVNWPRVAHWDITDLWHTTEGFADAAPNGAKNVGQPEDYTTKARVE